MPVEGEPSVELSRWLVEVGRRRYGPRHGGSVPVAGQSTMQRHDSVQRVVLLGLLGAAWLQYFYLDALLEITSLRSLIVFVVARTAT